MLQSWYLERLANGMVGRERLVSLEKKKKEKRKILKYDASSSVFA